MLMMMYAAPPFPLLMDGMEDTGELCTSSPGMSCTPVTPQQLQGLRGDPFGISDVIGGITGFLQSKEQAAAQQKAIEAQIQMAKMQANEQAQTQALTAAQTQVQEAQSARNTTLYGLYAIGGVATIVGVAFLLSAIRSKK